MNERDKMLQDTSIKLGSIIPHENDSIRAVLQYKAELIKKIEGLKQIIPKIAGTQYEGEIRFNEALDSVINIIKE